MTFQKFNSTIIKHLISHLKCLHTALILRQHHINICILVCKRNTSMVLEIIIYCCNKLKYSSFHKLQLLLTHCSFHYTLHMRSHVLVNNRKVVSEFLYCFVQRNPAKLPHSPWTYARLTEIYTLREKLIEHLQQ